MAYSGVLGTAPCSVSSGVTQGTQLLFPTRDSKFPSLPVLGINMTSVLGSFFQKIAEGAREEHSLSPVRTEKPRKMIGSQLTALLQRGGVHLGAAEEGRCLQAAP